MTRTITRIKAALRNAVVWGVAWGAAAFVTILAMRTVGLVVPPSIRLIDALGMAIRIGIVGGIAGVAFAGVIRLVYRGRRLADINALRFGLGGGVLAGALVPSAMEILSLLTGGGVVPWSLIRGDTIIATLFGAMAAGGTIKLAQLAESRSRRDAELLDAADAVPELQAGAEAPVEFKQRTRQRNT